MTNDDSKAYPALHPLLDSSKAFLVFALMAAVGVGMGFAAAATEAPIEGLLAFMLAFVGLAGGLRLILRTITVRLAGPGYLPLATLPPVLLGGSFVFSVWTYFQPYPWAELVADLLGWFAFAAFLCVLALNVYAGIRQVTTAVRPGRQHDEGGP